MLGLGLGHELCLNLELKKTEWFFDVDVVEEGKGEGWVSVRQLMLP